MYLFTELDSHMGKYLARDHGVWSKDHMFFYPAWPYSVKHRYKCFIIDNDQMNLKLFVGDSCKYDYDNKLMY